MLNKSGDSIHPCLTPRRICTVSYTHLDVYKRQSRMREDTCTAEMIASSMPATASSRRRMVSSGPAGGNSPTDQS